MVDLRELSADEIYAKLSSEVRVFFESFPIEPTEDKRLKVTRVLSSWKYYMDEISSKKSEVDYFEYKETQRAIARAQEAKWQNEQKRVTQWVVCNQPHLKHAEIFAKHARVQQIYKARKLEKKAQASSAEHIMSDSSEPMEIEQDSGSRR